MSMGIQSLKIQSSKLFQKYFVLSVLLFLLLLATVGHNEISKFVPRLDDQTMLFTYLHIDGSGARFDGIADELNHHYTKGSRFPFTTPPMRYLQAVVFGYEYSYYLLFTLANHLLNGLLFALFCFYSLKLSRIKSLLLATFFVVGASYTSGLSALTLWIGSGYIYLATVILLFALAFSWKQDNKRIVWSIAAIYSLFASSQLGMVVMAPIVSLIYIAFQRNFNNFWPMLFILGMSMLPAVIYLLAPEASYSGTRVSLDLDKIIHSFTNNTVRLFGEGKQVWPIIGLLLLLAGYTFAAIKEQRSRVLLVAFLLLVVMLPMLFSLSERKSYFGYFLYPSFLGMCLILAVVLQTAQDYAKPLNRKFLYALVAVLTVIYTYNSYQSNQHYLKIMENLSVSHSSFVERYRKVTTEVERAGIHDSVVVLLDKEMEGRYSKLRLGTHDYFLKYLAGDSSNLYLLARDYGISDRKVTYDFLIQQYVDKIRQLKTIQTLFSTNNKFGSTLSRRLLVDSSEILTKAIESSDIKLVHVSDQGIQFIEQDKLLSMNKITFIGQVHSYKNSGRYKGFYYNPKLGLNFNSYTAAEEGSSLIISFACDHPTMIQLTYGDSVLKKSCDSVPQNIELPINQGNASYKINIQEQGGVAIGLYAKAFHSDSENLNLGTH